MSTEVQILHTELSKNGYEVPKQVLDRIVLEVGTVDNSNHSSEYGKSENRYNPTFNNDVRIDMDRVGKSLDSQATFFLVAMAVEFIVVLVLGIVIGVLW